MTVIATGGNDTHNPFRRNKIASEDVYYLLGIFQLFQKVKQLSWNRIAHRLGVPDTSGAPGDEFHIVFQPVGSMALTKYPLIAGNLFILVPDLNSRAKTLDRDRSARQVIRDGVQIGVKPDQREVTDCCPVGTAGIVAVGRQWNKSRFRSCQHLCNRELPVTDLVGIVIGLTLLCKIAIQLRQGRYLWDRNQKVIPGILYQILHQTLFMALGGITEVGAEGIVSGQLRITFLGLCILTEAFFDTHLGIVKDDPPGRTAKEFQTGLNSFQEGFLILPHEGHDEHSAGGTFPHTEIIDIQAVTADIGLGTAPVDLHSFAGVKGQRDKYRLLLGPLSGYRSTNCRFPNLNAQFLLDAVVDPFCGVLLFG